MHEPPLVGLLADRPEFAEEGERFLQGIDSMRAQVGRGDRLGAARNVVEVFSVAGGTWERLPESVRAGFAERMDRWSEEYRRPRRPAAPSRHAPGNAGPRPAHDRLGESGVPPTDPGPAGRRAAEPHRPRDPPRRSRSAPDRARHLRRTSPPVPPRAERPGLLTSGAGPAGATSRSFLLGGRDEESPLSGRRAGPGRPYPATARRPRQAPGP